MFQLTRSVTWQPLTRLHERTANDRGPQAQENRTKPRRTKETSS